MAPPGAGPPVASDPDAEVFVEPDDGPEPLLAAINSAGRSIDLVMYLLTDRQVIGALENAERRGVKVRALLEQRPFGQGPGNAEVFARLQRAGVEVRWTDPRFKLTHEKSAVIDGRDALILTMNLTASAFSRNREYGALDRSPEDVAEVGSLFESDWSRRAYSPSRPSLVVSPDNSRARLLALIASAVRSLEVECEEVQDEGLERALVAAVSRGVSVRLVLSPSEDGRDANARGVQRLKAGGVQVRYMRKPFVHAKMFVADGQTAFVGSENISAQSLDSNRELGVFVGNPVAVARIRATFEQDWNARS